MLDWINFITVWSNNGFLELFSGKPQQGFWFKSFFLYNYISDTILFYGQVALRKHVWLLLRHNICYKGLSSRVYYYPFINFNFYESYPQMYWTEYGTLCWSQYAYVFNDFFQYMLRPVNLEFEKNTRWLCANKLSLKFAKLLFAIFIFETLNYYPQLFIRGRWVPFEKKTKILWVKLDNNLKIADNISESCTKLRRSVSIIKKHFRFLFQNLFWNICFIALYIPRNLLYWDRG